MDKRNWTKAIFIAGLLALSSTASMAGTVELVVIPCTPQLRPDECGVKISATDGAVASFTTNSGETVNIPAGTVVSVSGTGIVSQSNQQGSIVNFASAGGETTGSIGGGGTGGGGGQTGQLPSGGNNTGGPTGNITPVNTASTDITGGVSGTSSNSVSPQ